MLSSSNQKIAKEGRVEWDYPNTGVCQLRNLLRRLTRSPKITVQSRYVHSSIEFLLSITDLATFRSGPQDVYRCIDATELIFFGHMMTVLENNGKIFLHVRLHGFYKHDLGCMHRIWKMYVQLAARNVFANIFLHNNISRSDQPRVKQGRKIVSACSAKNMHNFSIS